MNIERALETQRRKLLRLVAGWLALVVFVSVGPFSRDFPRWVTEFIASVIGRAETAAQYLLVTQARVIAAGTGRNFEREQYFECAALALKGRETDNSLSSLRKRLQTLRALLENLTPHSLRLLRRIEKRIRRATRTPQTMPHPETLNDGAICAWRLTRVRIERPPDKGVPIPCSN